jgi:hypothetical protein
MHTILPPNLVPVGVENSTSYRRRRPNIYKSAVDAKPAHCANIHYESTRVQPMPRVTRPNTPIRHVLVSTFFDNKGPLLGCLHTTPTRRVIPPAPPPVDVATPVVVQLDTLGSPMQAPSCDCQLFSGNLVTHPFDIYIPIPTLPYTHPNSRSTHYPRWSLARSRPSYHS